MDPIDLRTMPRVDRVVSHPLLAEALTRSGVTRVTALVRLELDEARAHARGGVGAAVPSEEDVAAAVVARLGALEKARARPVINATGVVLHTNLGRAPLSRAAVRALSETAGHYTSVELALESGKRGRRGAYSEDALARLTSAEAALVVNNCAAAVLLALSALARGTDVIVSRGELTEIGGGFRIPEILEESGARLVEVGTTNKTRASDYERALARSTNRGAILRVHQGNFRMTGFVERPTLAELVKVAHTHGVPLVKDLGGGALVELAKYGLAGEPTVAASIAAGADLVIFSTDKALGGPQGGALVGRRELVDRARKAPLARAVRLGRLPLVALEATLASYLGERADDEIPTLSMSKRSDDALADRAKRWADAIAAPPFEGAATVVPTRTEMGGGTLAGIDVGSYGVALNGAGSATELALRLRTGDPPIMARVDDGRVILDARTVLDGEDDALVLGAREALGGDFAQAREPA